MLIGSAGLAPLIVNDYYLAFGLYIFMMLALAQSWNLISGTTGYISFGHVVFFGFGAYTAALIVPLGIPWPWAIICGAGVALILAIPLGLLTLRLRGPYFAIAMLGLNEVARILVTLWVDLTRGGSGISIAPALLPELSATYYSIMTVEDNLELGAFLIADSRHRRASVTRVFTQFPQLAERRRTLVGSLSGGEQQMLAIGRALMLDPKLVILDEPSLGLSPKYVDLIFERLLDLKQQGRALLMVEQNAARALALADRAYALELGCNRFTGTGAAMLANPEVRRMYLGGSP